MIQIVPNNELIELYREWAKNDPIFLKAVEYLETGGIKRSRLNFNVKCRDRIRELRRNGKSWEFIHDLFPGASIETLKTQLHKNNMAEDTAKNCYYKLK